ncbi:hypothetical protein ACMU_02675 [Actibacterium mucosum KCTC 23349]|uniref:DUF2975 domain-containing protein n=1 Tax=Actibacterium mucosum KCTC 23349 TaxID=1454373 RepID=A0A037ZRG9_9RHOB|nr:DUF2975 domain-containing protein [Actibacterium mucosum]KAJ57427.1 hypothetical protein ACMU_02675 [Actibacterium mucosum KCTC 23349]
MTQLPSRTRQLSAVFRVLSLVSVGGFALFALLVVFALVTKSALGFVALEHRDETGVLATALLAAFALIGAAATIAALWYTARLFGIYAKGEPLSVEAADTLRLIAFALLAKAGLAILSPIYTSLVLSIDALPGARSLTVSLDMGQLGLLLAAGLIYTVGVVMRQAVDIAAENRGFV